MERGQTIIRKYLRQVQSPARGWLRELRGAKSAPRTPIAPECADKKRAVANHWRSATALFREKTSPLFEDAVEFLPGWREIELTGEFAGVVRAENAIHSAIFPFDGKRSRVTDLIEGADDRFEVDFAVTGTAEVPAAPGIAEVEVRSQDAAFAVERDGGVLDMAMVDAVGESAEEFDGIDALPVEVARVEVETEFLAAADRFEGAFGGVEVKGDLGRMDFEREFDAVLAVGVHDRIELISEKLIASFDLVG